MDASLTWRERGRRARALTEEPSGPRHEAGTLGPAAPELAEQGVELLAIEGAEERPQLLAQMGSGPDPSWPREALVAEGWFTGGYVVRVPAGVQAEFPLHVSAGPRRFGSVERSLVILEPRSSLTLVDGCTDIGGPGGPRWSLLDVSVGEGATLVASSIQSWPAAVESRALKRLRVAAGGRVEWSDVGLSARLIEKTITVELARGASADLLCAGYAAPGQRQRLTLDGTGRILAAGDIEAAAAEVRRHDGGDAASLRRFFEPLARRLPLEFSVEFSRLLEAQL